VMKYLPSEFKAEEKAEAGKAGGEARAEAYRESQDFATRRVAEIEPEIEHRVAKAAEVQRNPRWTPPELTRQPEPVTTSIPAPTETPPEPKPEALDVADFTCPECHRSFRISHVANNLHKLVPIKEEPA